MIRLKLLVVVCLIGLLPACSSNINPTSTSNFQPTEIPTQVATPSKETIPGLSVEVTKPDEQLLIEALGQFANAFQLTSEQSENVKQGIQLVELKDKDGKTFIIAVTPDIPESKDFDETSTPLLIATQAQKSGEWVWKEIGLRDLADALGIKIGGLIDPEAEFWKNTAWQKRAAHEFNLGVLGFYWHVTIPKQDDYFFGLADSQMSFAKENNMDLRAEPLLVGNFIPGWLKNGSFTKDQWIKFIQKYIPVFMNRYHDINTWVVINEAAFNYPYSPGDLFYQNIGKEYVEIAYQTARQTNPSATLIYGDFENYTLNGPKYKQTKQIVETLKQEGLIDGVGIEIHIDASHPIPSKQELVEAMKSYGLPIYITELDINLKNVGGTNIDRFALQAKISQTLIEAALESGIVKQITFWNIGDKYSYLEQTEFNGATNADPTPFDDNLAPKSNYYTITKTLLSALLNR